MFLLAGCKKSKESEMQAYAEAYNDVKNEIIKGNNFKDTKAYVEGDQNIVIDVVINGGTKAAVKKFLLKYEPKKLTKAIDYVADPTNLIDKGVIFKFRFYDTSKSLIIEKNIDQEAYLIYSNDLKARRNPDLSQSFYKNILDQALEKMNKNLPKTTGNNTLVMHQILQEENNYLLYQCSCKDTKPMKSNNRVLKERFSKRLTGFEQFRDVYILMSELSIKALRIECKDQETNKLFDFVYYKKDVLELY